MKEKMENQAESRQNKTGAAGFRFILVERLPCSLEIFIKI